MNRYEPRLRPLSVLRRDPIIRQDIVWEFGPNVGDNSSLSVTVVGNTLTISEKGKTVFDCPLDRARLLHEAIGNVLAVAFGGGQPTTETTETEESNG